MGMVVRVDQAGHHQPPGCIDHLVLAVAREVRSDRDDIAALDQDVGNRRVVDVALMVVDLSTPNQQLCRACHDVKSLLIDCRLARRALLWLATGNTPAATCRQRPLSTCC